MSENMTIPKYSPAIARLQAENDKLRAAFEALTVKCEDFAQAWEDFDWGATVKAAAESDLNTEYTLYFHTGFGALEDSMPDLEQARAMLRTTADGGA